MNYQPEALHDRKVLAASLEKMLAEAKFVKTSRETTEDVYELEIPQIPGAAIVVFSSIYHGAAREVGADAIRVAVLYRAKDDSTKSLIKSANVHRVGTIEGITDRTLARMRAAYATMRDRHNGGMRCKFCGAPFFLSKRGHEVCAETCWTTR